MSGGMAELPDLCVPVSDVLDADHDQPVFADAQGGFVRVNQVFPAEYCDGDDPEPDGLRATCSCAAARRAHRRE